MPHLPSLDQASPNALLKLNRHDTPRGLLRVAHQSYFASELKLAISVKANIRCCVRGSRLACAPSTHSYSPAGFRNHLPRHRAATGIGLSIYFRFGPFNSVPSEIQFSIFNPGTFEKCEVLFVTSVKSFALATAAMNMSSEPIGVPAVSSATLMSA